MSPSEKRKLQALEQEILAIARVLIGQATRQREEGVAAGTALVNCTRILGELKAGGGAS